MKKGQIEELEDINYGIRTNWIGFFPLSYTLSIPELYYILPVLQSHVQYNHTVWLY